MAIDLEGSFRRERPVRGEDLDRVGPISVWSLHGSDQRRRPELARELLGRAVREHAGHVVGVSHQPGRAPVAEGLAVSLSRTDDAAMCVVVEIGPVGIDVERLKPWEELHEIVPLVTNASPSDASDLLSLWTRKEALAKAMGIGLPDDVRALDVPFESLEPGQWQRRDGWLWIGCPCEDGCVASLVLGQSGPDAHGTCDVAEAELDEPDVRAWSIEVRT